jgi:hypothetical protein
MPPVESAFFRSILSNPDKAMEKCRTFIRGDPSILAWATGLSRIATRLIREEEAIMKRELVSKHNDAMDPMMLPFDVLGLIFSYLSTQAATRIQCVNRKWHGIQTLHIVPWTIGPHGFLDMPFTRFKTTTRSAKLLMLNSGFARNAIAFRFGSMPFTAAMMYCVETMSKLKRIQMPNNTSNGKRGVDGEVIGYQYYMEKFIVARGNDISHLAVTLWSSILTVYRFPNLTSLLVGYGGTQPMSTFVVMDVLIQTLAEDVTLLPQLANLGLHHTGKVGALSVNRVVGLVEGRSNLMTLSLTGLYYIERDEIRKLLHPACGLRSLAVHVPQSDDGASWQLDGILAHSCVSLLVLCLPDSARLLSKAILWSLFVSGFEPLRSRNVRIEGHTSYESHPFKRSGSAGDLVWGLTGGSVFSK